MKIKYVNTDATKGTLPVGTLGYDAYVAGGDEGRVGVGTASGNVLLAKKSEVDLKAPLASPVLTGVPEAPTAAAGTNTTQLATTEFVNAEIANDTYSQTELDNGQLDNRYYTETESDILFEPADTTILKDADIGSTVQAYDANTTTQGNTFNGISQLVQTDDTGKLPAIDGSQLTGLATGFKNLIINGDLSINQRAYISGTATTAANEYTLDRWRVVTSGQNLTFSTTAGTVTATAPAGGVEQEVEGTFLRAGTYVISWSGTATCTVNGTARTNGESFTLTGGANATIKLSSGTFSYVQLEPGSVASSFEQTDPALKLIRCQRYYWTNGGYDSIGTGTHVAATYTQSCSVWLPVSMRVAPTATIKDDVGTAGNAKVRSDYLATRVVATVNTTAHRINIQFNGTTPSSTAGFAVSIYAELTASAEL